MPSFTAGEIERCLTRKLQAIEREGGRHRHLVVSDADGRIVAIVPVSRSWRKSQSLGPSMVAMIQQELHLRGKGAAFEDLVRCPLSREQYLALVGAAIESDSRPEP